MLAHTIHAQMMLLLSVQRADELLSEAVDDVEVISKLQRSSIEEHVTVWAEAQHVPCLVRAVVRLSQGMDVCCLAVRIAARRHYETGPADLARVVVHLLDFCDDLRVTNTLLTRDHPTHLFLKAGRLTFNRIYWSRLCFFARPQFQ
ncbi:hypothetical protein ADK47_37870 [Streptomyces rimosus subsp. rimosus]|nr:hypothetical protein DF17_28480 [Streptomyces rimosus]KOG76456.1 hypothetical protein ADK78_10260 [Kitasatospora aureofaciens]KOT41208.1 hypothetical protein ADK84_12745 [Streptomyces sp. NRRL WC-3701]KOT46179.1 hypothetical protein ADK42_01650 [Streptomyces rimosus subsp. rimosus]KEF21262.1 hypothetical protein DF18_08780 [Streptomyces rimosus]